MIGTFPLNRLKRLSGWLLLVIALAFMMPAGIASAAESAVVAVGVNSGKVFVGQVDPRTNEYQLWLRTGRSGIEIRRPIEWESILLVRKADREFTAGDFRTEVLSSQTSATALTLYEPNELPVPACGASALEANANRPKQSEHIFANRPNEWLSDDRLARFIQAARANNTQVCSLSIDAHVANLNRSVEADGMVLHVYPLDGAGNMIPVDGTLDIDLIASVPPGWPRGEPLPAIGRWTVRLVPQQFGPAGAIVKLPFQNVHPEFDLNIGPYGLVHARLSVPGNGSFETSEGMLRIRPYSIIRDQWQQIDGRRFFDLERVDRRGW
jgi:hypothetical protein